MDNEWFITDERNELFTALSQFQALGLCAEKTNVNPHLRSKYADFADVQEVAKRATEFGLSVTTFPVGGGSNGEVSVVGILAHKSGQYMQTTFTLSPSKRDVQGWGGAFTYARRYFTQMCLGIPADEDLDGEDTKAKTTTASAPTVDWEGRIKAAKTDAQRRSLWTAIGKSDLDPSEKDRLRKLVEGEATK